MEELIVTRTKLRTKATKLCNDLKAVRQEDPSKLDQDQLALKLHHGDRLLKEMQTLQLQLDKGGQMDESSHVQTLEDEIFLGSRILSRVEKAEEAGTRHESKGSVGSADLKSSLSVKIPVFHGDLMKWSEFWELFAISVHDNPSYANVQKFVVLKSHLADAALRAIQGIPVSGDGYVEAVTALKERFEQDDVRRETLMKELLNLPAVRSNDLKALRSLIDHLSAHTRALNSLGVSTESFSSLLLPIAKEKLPESWRIQWARLGSSDFQRFLKFLQEEIRVQESAKGVVTSGDTHKTSAQVPSVSSSLNTRQVSGATAMSRFSPKAVTCPVCTQTGHKIRQCERFQKLTTEARWEAVKNAKACFRCLGIGHQARTCRAEFCSECGKNHHTLLHHMPRSVAPPGLSAAAAPFSPASAPNHGTGSGIGSGESPRPQSQHRYNATGERGGSCFFQTALVEAEGPNGSRWTRVLLDGGSDSSYIRSSLVEELGLPVTGTGIFSCIGFQEKMEQPCQYDRVGVSLRSRFGDNSVRLELWKTDRVCASLPTHSPLQLPAEVSEKMADDFQGGHIDILIGIDNLYRIVLWDQVDVGEGLRAVDTVFGFVMHGREKNGCCPTIHRSNHQRRVENMWDLDLLGISEAESSDAVSDSSCSPPRWNEAEGRYEMSLMWKSDDRPVSNQDAAAVRTKQMTQRLGEDKFHLYHGQIMDMLEGAVIEECEDRSQSTYNRMQAPALHQTSDHDPLEEEEHAFFLPHRGVFGRDKLRIVFDGSAGDGVGKSLNDYLQAGGNLLLKLPAVLLNFRIGEVGCQSDIKAAFHQVSVALEDRRYLQFFWLEQRLRFARVPFGITCSPHMLLKTIDTHLSDYEVSDANLCAKVRAGIYMDDICTSFDSLQNAEGALTRMNEIFQDANMHLHKSRITGDSTPDEKILGMLWSTNRDELAVVVSDLPSPGNKRELLSVISRTFDPLGILAPWLIKGKILFQRLWIEMPTGSWEDPLPETMRREVRKWWENSHAHRPWFPRSLCASETPASDAVFHVFCDASQQAYCAVVYLVSEGQSRLVMAKSRLAPLKPHLTIPRMELLAALIGARLMKFVLMALQRQESDVVFWTDSTDVLCWLVNRKSRKVFVENRVSAILELTKPGQWKHVCGLENPADLGTRGIPLKTLASQELWWHGPKFICDPQSCQTEADVVLELSSEAKAETNPETPPKVTATVVNSDLSMERERLFDITACSTLKQVVNRTAWVKRFACNCRKSKEDRVVGFLTPLERQEAVEFWIKDAQEKVFASEIACIQQDTLLPVGSALTKLRPQMNDAGVVCAVPRTHEPPLPILPEFAHITMLIVDEAHRRCFHQGARVTLALLSTEYLVRRRSVNRVVSTCRRCRRYKGLSYQSADGGLPSFRTEPSRAFSKVGIDFFGPLYVDEGHKAWVLLFTCATSRAVHLELVRSQNTEEVKRALRRFFALRSTPDLIVSDNAKTFHSLLSHIPRSVTWRFIPEAAPWWGGFWERLVGITKRCLKITLHQCHLSFENLAVVLYELAFHLNLRPLTSADGEILTPAHLLFGVPSIQGVISQRGYPEGSLSRAWKHRRRVEDHLIRRWNREYVASLRSWSVSPRGRPTRLPSIGDIVLVHGEGPRCRWPLARVEGLIIGSDGKPRAANILIRGKKTRRPINKLFQLEAAAAIP